MEDLKDIVFMTAPAAVREIYDATFKTRWCSPAAQGIDYASRRNVLVVTHLLHEVLQNSNVGPVSIPSLSTLRLAHVGVALVIETHQSLYQEGLFVRQCIETLMSFARRELGQSALLDILPTYS